MPVHDKPFTFRRCVLLCLPALIVGAILRISFLIATPPVYYGSDSNSYFTTADRLWNKGKFDIPAKRRYLYPVFLAAVVALPGPAAPAVAIIQHAVGLATILGIGWIVGQVTRRPILWVAPVTIIAAMWPRMLWYEHEMIAEVFVLGALVLTVALALPLQRLRTSRGLLIFLISAGVIIAVKPHGRPFWLALIVLALVYTWRHLPWKWPHWTVVAASLFVLVTGGSGSQGSWLLLSSSLPLVKTEGGKWPEYRKILRPIIEEARVDLENYATSQGRYKKILNDNDDDSLLGPEWVKLQTDKKQFAKVAKSLAISGILAEPVVFTQMLYRKVMCVLGDTSPRSSIVPQQFWEQQDENSEGRWSKHPETMTLIYGGDEAAYDRMKEETRANQLWFAKWVRPFSAAAPWVKYWRGKVGQPPHIGMRWSGWLLFLGLVTSMWPSRFWRTAIIWFPPLVYCLLIYTVGDALTRYLHPVDWSFLVIAALGLDAVCDVGQWLLAKLRPSPALAAV